MRLDYLATKKYVRMECATAGLGVVFHKRGEIPGPHTDGKNLHLFEPQYDWDDDKWLEWEYEAQHEIGHESPENTAPHWKDMLKEKKVHSATLLGSMWNLMSDHVQEHNRMGKMTGRDDVLKRGRAKFVVERLLNDTNLNPETPEGVVFKLAAMYDTLRRARWNELLAGVAEAATATLEGSEADLWEKLYNSGIKIEEGKNEYDAYDLAKRILDVLGVDSEEEERKARKAYEAAEKAGKGEGKEGKGKASKGKGKGEGKGKAAVPGELSEEAKKEIEGMVFHTHYEKPEGKGQYNDSFAGQHIEYDRHDYSSAGFTPRDFVEIDMKSQDYGGRRNEGHYRDSTATAIKQIDGGKLLASKTKRLLVSMKQAQWQHGQRRGSISNKNLWKARGPIYSQDVFRKKVQKLEMDTAVTVLCDFSGSMSGSKYAHAAKAGIMLNDAMGKIGVPIELLGFSESYESPTHVVIKAFSEVRIDEDELIDRYAIASNWMSNNSDGESIMWAFNRLRKRDEKRKVLIVLSDGSPASYNGSRGSEYGFTRDVIKQIEEHSKVEIYGVGIMDSNVERFYKDHKVIRNSSELEDMLIGLVKNKLLKVS